MRIYKNNHEFEDWESRYDSTDISLLDEDTFTIAAGEDNACCLNFASHRRPGGGYKAVQNLRMIIKTQEEDLFRRSDLPYLMDIPEVREHYPLMGLTGLYCSATVTKDKHLDPVSPFAVGVVTVPAVVNPAPDEPLVGGKVRRILEIAADNDHSTLILGAWGCGVFNNDPVKISELFMTHLNGDFKGVFKKVIFGVPGEGSYNYRAFQESVL